MSSLTDDQRKMIEEKKKAAQAKLAAKFSQSNLIPKQQTATKINNNQCTLSKTVSVIPPSPNGKPICINYNISSKITKCIPIQGTCELISNNRFTVNVGYHQQLIDTFKTIASKSYGRYYLENR